MINPKQSSSIHGLQIKSRQENLTINDDAMTERSPRVQVSHPEGWEHYRKPSILIHDSSCHIPSMIPFIHYSSMWMKSSTALAIFDEFSKDKYYKGNSNLSKTFDYLSKEIVMPNLFLVRQVIYLGLVKIHDRSNYIMKVNERPNSLGSTMYPDLIKLGMI